MRTPGLVTLLGSAVAAWPLVVYAQEFTTTQPSQAMRSKAPQVHIVRVRIDPAAAKFQFRLSDSVVDLMKGFSLADPEGIGGAWKMPAVDKTFDARYGRW